MLDINAKDVSLVPVSYTHLFAHARNENTVNNIIEGIDEHGKHHRDTHTQQQ